MNLPTETGFYLWYILDFGYFKVGCVNVLQDDTTHLEYLRSKKPSGVYLYDVPIGRTLSMYQQAHDHLPPCDSDGKPLVDGYIPFDFRTVPANTVSVRASDLALVPECVWSAKHLRAAAAELEQP